MSSSSYSISAGLSLATIRQKGQPLPTIRRASCILIFVAKSFVEGDRDGHLPQVQAHDSQERQPHQARVRLVSQDLPRQGGPRRQVARLRRKRRAGRRIAPAPPRGIRLVEG